MSILQSSTCNTIPSSKNRRLLRRMWPFLYMSNFLFTIPIIQIGLKPLNILNFATNHSPAFTFITLKKEGLDTNK